MDQVLLDRINEHAQNVTFLNKLKELLDKHEADLVRQKRCEAFVSRLVADSAGKYAQCLLALNKRPSLFYGERDWVPDEYQALEDYGLVHCYFGPASPQGLRSRELTITEAGRDAAEKISLVVQ